MHLVGFTIEILCEVFNTLHFRTQTTFKYFKALRYRITSYSLVLIIVKTPYYSTKLIYFIIHNTSYVITL